MENANADLCNCDFSCVMSASKSYWLQKPGGQTETIKTSEPLESCSQVEAAKAAIHDVHMPDGPRRQPRSHKRVDCARVACQALKQVGTTLFKGLLSYPRYPHHEIFITMHRDQDHGSGEEIRKQWAGPFGVPSFPILWIVMRPRARRPRRWSSDLIKEEFTLPSPSKWREEVSLCHAVAPMMIGPTGNLASFLPSLFLERRVCRCLDWEGTTRGRFLCAPNEARSFSACITIFSLYFSRLLVSSVSCKRKTKLASSSSSHLLGSHTDTGCTLSIH